MPSGDGWERLLQAMVDFYSGPGAAGSEAIPSAEEALREHRAIYGEALDPGEAHRIERAVLALRDVAAAVAGDGSRATPPWAIRAALGGAPWVIEGEIVAGRTHGLPAKLPDFAYLVTLPLLGHDEARDRSELLATRLAALEA